MGEGEEEQDSPEMSAVSSAWGKSHQMLVWGKMSRKHAPFHLIPPKAPAVSSCFFKKKKIISQILHHTVPSCHIL